MAFYAFSLDFATVKFQRGKLTDVDMVTFIVKVNQVVRGKGIGVIPAASGGGFNYSEVPIDKGSNIRRAQPGNLGWIIGPLDIAPGDLISVIYTGTNISDNEGQLDAQKRDEVEVKLLDALVTAAIGAVGGPVASAVGAVLGFIGDPIGKFLGFTKEGPCNGPVFSDAVPFTGAGLNTLPFQPQFHPDIPDSRRVVFINGSAGAPGPSYTDEATHDTGTCGHIAETDVQFSVWKLPPSISLRFYVGERFGIRAITEKTLRQLGSPPFSARSLLGV